MKLRNILDFKTFMFGDDNQDVYIILEIPTNSPALNNLDLLGESQWREAPGTNLFYRVDAQGAAAHQYRHVHVAGKKHVNSKNKQVSWNIVGTRHDKSSFNTNFKVHPTKAYLASWIARILSLKNSWSRNPYACRFIVLILLFVPSRGPVLIG